MISSSANITEDILHICVVGFHHKKGCQVEFSYPPIEPLPDAWKHLPSLAMPDGAHNYSRDTVFFHLPSVTTPVRTVFGVSCFQQVPLEKVKNKTEDMTRSTVQKAVCVLATAPLYGYIQVKMELITAAFFDGGDFSDTKILHDAFQNLRDCLPGSSQQHLYDGLSVRDLLVRFRHRLLILFKLMLLERKVVLFQSPVQSLCTNLLSLVSLLPYTLQYGLFDATSNSCAGSPVTPTPSSLIKNASKWDVQSDRPDTGEPSCARVEEIGPTSEISEGVEAKEKELQNKPSGVECAVDALRQREHSSNSSIACDPLGVLADLDLSGCGFPLEIFRKSNLCYPYLSISYLDFLVSPSLRGFLVGATNVLFKQKRSVWEVLVEVDESRIETTCPELSRTLALTTEDLRFMETVVRVGLDATNPADEDCLRAHFHLYLATLLRTSLLPDGSREIESFNSSFVSTWQLTHNFKMWAASEHSAILRLDPVHPGTGSLSVQDVKLKISQAMMSSESGRKINAAVANTGKAVGGAVNQARGVISGWWNSYARDGNPVKAIDHI